MPETPKYVYQIDMSDDNLSHTKILKQVAEGSRVLEIGCSTGYLTRYLKEKLHCRVSCIEIDEVAANQAAPFAEHLIVGDIEFLDLEKALAGRLFDVVIMADVIEHLKDGAALLSRVKAHIAPQGYVLLSIPNAAHGGTAAELLDGKWEYRRLGLLDESHIRFYDRFGIQVLLDETGFLVSRLERARVHPRDTEMRVPWDAYPREITAYIEKVNPEYQTYQFILKAYPLRPETWQPGLADALRHERHQRRVLKRRLAQATRSEDGRKAYEAAIAALQVERQRLAAQQEQVHDICTRLQAEAAEARHQAAACQALLAGARQDTAAMQNSTAWRLISRYRQVVEALLPPQSLRRKAYTGFIRSLRGLYREGPGYWFAKPVPQLTAGGGAASSRPEGAHDLRSGTIGEESVPMAGPLVSSKWPSLSLPQFETPQVSILIPVYNQWGHTHACLEAIVRHTLVPYEIIVVDNASEDETASLLPCVQGIRLIRNAVNKGFVDACNQAAEKARGEFLLFLNNDTQVTQDWLGAMLRLFEDPGTAIVGAKLVYPDGRLQEAGGAIFQDASGCNYGRNQDPSLPQYNYVREVDYCSGACLMIRRQIWLAVGGFDTRFSPAYYEDTDLCFKVRKEGYKVMYQPAAEIIHHEGATAGTDIQSGMKQYQAVNQDKFRDKWQEVLSREHYANVADIHLARERGRAKQVLVIDRYVPQPDMDSGSQRMHHILKLLAGLGCKVVFWPHDMQFQERYTPGLQQIGIEVLYGDLGFDTYMKVYGEVLDVVVLSRMVVAVHYIDKIRTYSKARIIYDTVDLHYIREGRKARLEAEELAAKVKQDEFELIQKADETWVVSFAEAELLKAEKLPGTISVVSNIHDIESCETSHEERRDLMFIGGFRHLPNEDGILWFVKRIFPLVLEQDPESHLYIVGSHPSQAVMALSGPNITVTGYVADVEPYFRKVRMSVCPLRYGAGVKGKVGQSLAFGVPVVATSIAAEGMGLHDGVDVLIANEPEVFAQKIHALNQDPALWWRLSENGRRLIEKHHAPEVGKRLLAALLAAK